MGERDKLHSYRHEPSAQGVDYSPLTMETVEKSSEKMETTPAAPRRSFPPLICTSRSLFWCFYVSATLPSGKHWGAIFIVGFRSRRSFGKKDRLQRSNEGKVVGPTQTKNLATWAYAFGPPLFRLLPSKKNGPLKFIGHLDVVWVPETQKYRK